MFSARNLLFRAAGLDIASRLTNKSKSMIVLTSRLSTQSKYLVDTRATVDSDQICFTRLSDAVRNEMYESYKSDSRKWSVEALAEKYRASPDRVKAILILMAKREEFLKSTGLLDNIQEWMSIYSRYQSLLAENAGKVEKQPAEGAEESSSVEDPKQVVCREFSKSESEINEIFSKVEDHLHRVSNADTFNNDFFEADPNDKYNEVVYQPPSRDLPFRETIDHMKSPFLENYYPELLADEDFEYGKAELLKRLKQETRVKVTPAMRVKEFLDKTFEVGEKFEGVQYIPESFSDGHRFCRWKFAVRDLSKPHKERVSMIRTRDGRYVLS